MQILSKISSRKFLIILTRDLKTLRGHMMPPPLHLSDIRCKCFQYRRCHGKQKSTVDEQTNEGVSVGC